MKQPDVSPPPGYHVMAAAERGGRYYPDDSHPLEASSTRSYGQRYSILLAMSTASLVASMVMCGLFLTNYWPPATAWLSTVDRDRIAGMFSPFRPVVAVLLTFI